MRYQNILEGKTKVKIDNTGPHEKILNESLKTLKMHQEKHFGGEAIQGNRLHLGYVSIREKTIL